MNTADNLLRLFMELPPRIDAIEHLLASHPHSSECISEAFCKFAEKCFCEYRDFTEEHGRRPLEEEIHSTYILPLCKMLLPYGLDPNYVFGKKHDEFNILFEIYWIDTPYIAADTLRILLEHGGDPLLQVNSQSIWEMADFDICFDVSYGYAELEYYKTQFDSRFRFWLVLRGFLFPGEEEYKNHSLYTYKIIHSDSYNWDLQVIPKSDQ